jgi:CRP-like cAMP-binding protein
MRKVLYIFSDLTDSDVEWLASAGRRKVFTKDEVLIEEGRPLSDVFVLLTGELSVVKRALSDSPVATLREGEIVGELSFLDSRPPSATVVANSNSVTLAISRDELRVKLSSDPSFAAHFYRALGVFLATRLRHTIESMGYAESASRTEGEMSPDEIDPDLMDSMSLAARRFEVLVERFSS